MSGQEVRDMKALVGEPPAAPKVTNGAAKSIEKGKQRAAPRSVEMEEEREWESRSVIKTAWEGGIAGSISAVGRLSDPPHLRSLGVRHLGAPRIRHDSWLSKGDSPTWDF